MPILNSLRSCVVLTPAMLVPPSIATAQPPASFTDLGSRLAPEHLVLPVTLDFARDIEWFRVVLTDVSSDSGFLDMWSEMPDFSSPSTMFAADIAILDSTGVLRGTSSFSGYYQQAKMSFGLQDPRAPFCALLGNETVCDNEGGFDGLLGSLAGGESWIAVGSYLNAGPDWFASSLVNPASPERNTILHIRIQPPDVPFCDPDFNWDGNADEGDVAYLLNVLAGGENPTGRFPDYNRDGIEDQDDLAALVNTIAGGGCP